MEHIKKLKLPLKINQDKAELLKGVFLEEDSFDTLVTEDTDAYDTNGKMLFRFRKGALPFDIIKLGYDSFKGSIEKTQGRGLAAGPYFYERPDGTIGKYHRSPQVESGNVGFMDARLGENTNNYCRKTAFAKKYFDKFQQGIPFVEYVDSLYKELCPTQYAKQIGIANGTDINFRIGKTSFTTVTVNKNFRTACHKDSGDLPEGFGNLCVYREGHYEGCYFCLPEYRVAIELQTTDMLFVDVHRWHGNTPFKNMSEDYLRVSFVMYYRENMVKCSNPKGELNRIKNEWGGFYRL